MLAASVGLFLGQTMRAASLRPSVLPVSRALRSGPAPCVPFNPLFRSLSTSILSRRSLQPPFRRQSTRWNSSVASEAAASTPSPGLIPIDQLTPELADVVAAVPPLQHGDFAALGLCHWTPPGLVQYSTELMHLATGFNWFWTIVATTVFWRLVIFPLIAISQKHSSRMRTIQPQLDVIMAKVTEARATGDTLAMQKASQAGAKLRASVGASLFGLSAGLFQLPVSIGMFFGFKRMCELPVPQLTDSGMPFLTDLTTADPTHILPIAVVGAGNIMIMMSARDIDMVANPRMGHIMNGLRLLSMVSLVWFLNLPSGLLLSMLVTSCSIMLQNRLLRVDPFRKLLGLPPWCPPVGGVGKLPTLLETAKFVSGSDGAATAPAVAPKAYMPPPRPMTPTPIPRASSSQPASSLFETPVAPAPTPRAKARKAKRKST
ncbi:unnamed protein product [Mycena citricolor]|uniref:Membrane insertase YidC/Oxa/ALB C-terminal domain-containing protein n=1 Tax=Mycena citricolor TaxID=2018698 RepID=A0AAD2H7T0_9AGAR|nr:unnamed protein product [Mycena citricolor]